MKSAVDKARVKTLVGYVLRWNPLTMFATKRVAVTEPVWAELSDLRRPGETLSQLLAELIE